MCEERGKDLGEEHSGLGNGVWRAVKGRSPWDMSAIIKKDFSHLEVDGMKRTSYASHCQPTENVGHAREQPDMLLKGPPDHLHLPPPSRDPGKLLCEKMMTSPGRSCLGS